MQKRSRKQPGSVQVLNVKLVPITDPAKQAAIDRIFDNDRITDEDRRILMGKDGKKSKEKKRNR
jgi:hypothetical protein